MFQIDMWLDHLAMLVYGPFGQLVCGGVGLWLTTRFVLITILFYWSNGFDFSKSPPLTFFATDINEEPTSEIDSRVPMIFICLLFVSAAGLSTYAILTILAEA